MRAMRRMALRRNLLIPILTALLMGVGPALSAPGAAQPSPPPKPAAAPERWRGLIGEYGPDDDVIIVLERDGKLWALLKHTELETLQEVDQNTFKFLSGPRAQHPLTFERDANGRATQLALDALVAKRRNIEPESGNQLHVTPVRPVAELMKEALAAQPPHENVHFLPTDLVELRKRSEERRVGK